jgi:hypothetical protein
VTQARRYRYVGPADLRGQVVTVDAVAVHTPATLDGWLAGRDRGELTEPVTFVVALDGVLWLAPRRSEHVACAGGQDVLAAGEMAFASDETGWRVTEVTNQSTGYCPDPDCWPAVARALDRVGLRHPGDFHRQSGLSSLPHVRRAKYRARQRLHLRTMQQRPTCPMEPCIRLIASQRHPHLPRVERLLSCSTGSGAGKLKWVRSSCVQPWWRGR